MLAHRSNAFFFSPRDRRRAPHSDGSESLHDERSGYGRYITAAQRLVYVSRIPDRSQAEKFRIASKPTRVVDLCSLAQRLLSFITFTSMQHIRDIFIFE